MTLSETGPDLDDWLLQLEVFCADVGSIAQSKFAWARRHPTGADEEFHQPSSIASLADAVAYQLVRNRPVALGFEMPIFVPVPVAPNELGKARPCDEGRTAWSQSTGASVMATGLVQLAWMLDRLRTTVPDAALHLDWEAFCTARTGLLLWEAFVNGPDKDPGDSHEADALIGVRAFCDQLPDPRDSRAARVQRPLSLAAGAALWAGWPISIEVLRAPCVLVRP